MGLFVCAIAAYLLEPAQHDGVGTGLAGEVRLKRTANTLTEARMSDQASELFRQIHPQFTIGVTDFGDELLAAINKRDDVAEISASEEVLLGRVPSAGGFD